MFAYLALPSCSLLLTYDTSLAIRFLSFKPGKQLFCLNKCGLRNDISSKTRAAIPLYRARERTNESIKPISRAIPRAGSLRDVKSGIVEAESKEPKEGLEYLTFLYSNSNSIPPCIHVEWGNSLGEPCDMG